MKSTISIRAYQWASHRKWQRRAKAGRVVKVRLPAATAAALADLATITRRPVPSVARSCIEAALPFLPR